MVLGRAIALIAARHIGTVVGTLVHLLTALVYIDAVKFRIGRICFSIPLVPCSTISWGALTLIATDSVNAQLGR
uniref:Uncharacterized protein n=1 Tax=Anopheles darlingi TaxID=43151 RepID=A0A2M4DQ51_ANODA